MRGPRRLFLTTLLGALVCRGAPCGAQTVEPSDEPAPAPGTPPAEQPKPAPRKLDKAAIEEAKRAYSAGETAFKAGDYKVAVQNFRDAQNIVPTAQAAYWLALSLKGDGQVPEAIAELKTLLASPSADKLGKEKLATAKATLDELVKTHGVITLSTEPPGATVSADGEVRPGVSPLAVDLAPGVHTLTISLPGYQSMELELEVPPGSKGEQKLSLTAIPPPPAPPPGAAPPAPSQTQQVVLHPVGKAPERSSKVGMYIVFGIAGVGAITGTIFGIKALGEKSDFDKNPSDATADDIERDATIADIAFGAAITFGVAGFVMATAKEDAPARETPTARISPRPRLEFSPYAGRQGGGARAVLRF